MTAQTPAPAASVIWIKPSADLSQVAGTTLPSRRFEVLPPLSMYIHLPWCVRKCPYCDFNSHESHGDPPFARYVDALITELQRALPEIWGRPVESVFFGGGTPSLFPPQEIARLLSNVRALVPLVPGAEVTLEANPGTVDADRFQAFKDAGVNRLSLGVQSLDDAALHTLGRIHNSRQARAAIDIALSIFERVNLDFMWGLPGQTLPMLEQELRLVAQLGATHWSLYQLTIEPNTHFERSPPVLPSDETLADMQDCVADLTSRSGFRRYEVSAYARPGAECRHNLNYWSFGDYLGLGAGAHSKLSFADRIERSAGLRHPLRYIESVEQLQPSHQEKRRVPDVDLPFEFMMNALRLVNGVDSNLYLARTGLDPLTLQPALRNAQQRGLMRKDPSRHAPTALGLQFLNDLVALYLP